MTPPGYRTDGSLWSGYEGVWHLDDVLDSSGNARNATSNGGVASSPAGLVGHGLSLDGNDDDLTISGYQGITGSGARRFLFGSGRHSPAADLPVGGRRVISGTWYGTVKALGF